MRPVLDLDAASSSALTKESSYEVPAATGSGSGLTMPALAGPAMILLGALLFSGRRPPGIRRG